MPQGLRGETSPGNPQALFIDGIRQFAQSCDFDIQGVGTDCRRIGNGIEGRSQQRCDR